MDPSGPDLHRLPRHAVVARMVSGSRAGGRRLRGATHVQRQGRKELAWRHTVVQHCALRASSVALGSNWTGCHRRLLAARRPPPLRRLMVAAFLAAFMSTIGTQLNWGSSYLVNDLYKRFFVKRATERHYVIISKVFTVLLVLGSGYTATKLSSINQGWNLVLNIGFGTGAVYILRWYWERINAWSEIVAMGVAAAMTIGLSRVDFTGNTALVYAKSALITGLVTTIAWIIATYVTRPESDATLIAFYKRVHPTVYGWHRIAKLVPELPEVRDVASNAFNWVMGCILVYGCLFGIGKLVFGEWGWGILLLAISAVAGYLIFWDLSRRGWATL